MSKKKITRSVFNCNYCKYTSDRFFNVKTHINGGCLGTKLFDRNIPVIKVLLSESPKTFLVKLLEEKKRPDAGTWNYCECGKTFTEIEKREFHDLYNCKVNSSHIKDLKEIEDSISKPFQCKKCYKHYKTKSYFKKHELICDGEKKK